LAAFIQYVGETLGAPKRSSEGGGFTLVLWSKGCAAITGLFYFQHDNPAYKTLINTYLSSVVLYEPPTTGVLGLPPDATAMAVCYGPIASGSGEDPGIIFAKYVNGFFRNTPEYLEQKEGQQIMEYYRTGAFDEDFQKYSGKAFEGDNLPANLHWFLADVPSDRFEACHEAFRQMAQSTLKKVGILWGSEGPPASLEGCWQIEKWLKEEKTVEIKVVTKQFDGGNHYIQFYHPKEFWTAILEISA
jgi:hypothetical protein